MNRVTKLIHADYVWKLGYTGKKVTVGILDTGIYYHKDFGNRILDFYDFTSGKTMAYDDNGHGTHVAGIIGGSGFSSKGKYKGVAPGCNFISLKVLDYYGNGNLKAFLKAFDWVLEHKNQYEIKIINISVGMIESTSTKEKKIMQEYVEKIWNSGIVVVAAAGNNGPKKGSITIPGRDKLIITVGCSDDYLPVMKEGLGCGYSGCGPTSQCIVKPELVAPGTNITSTNNKKNGYTSKSGTSMATPVVTGAIALLLEKYPDLSPGEVKLKLYSSTTKIDKPKGTQGWGMIDVGKMF